MKLNKLALILAVLLSAGTLCAEVIDKVAVVVNGEIITQGEIDRLVYPAYEQYKKMHKGDELVKKLEEARQQIISQLIEEKLVLSEAKKLNIEATDEEVEAKIGESAKRFGSRENFEAALKEQRLAMKELRSRYREQIISRKLVDQKISAKISVTPVEIDNYYRNHSDQFTQPEAVRIRNIMIKPPTPADRRKTFNFAKELVQRIKDGCDFAGLAKQYSEGPGAIDGGMMGYVRHGDMMPEIEKVIFNLKEGEISDVVTTSIGYHIFKVEEKRPPVVMTLSEVKQDVEEMIFRDKIKEKLKGWIEVLKKNAYIAFK